jgi:hypothetical protein
VEQVHNDIGSTIQQYEVAADKDVCAIGRWRREPTLKVFRTRLEALLEAGRERTAASKLFFQPRR